MAIDLRDIIRQYSLGQMKDDVKFKHLVKEQDQLTPLPNQEVAVALPTPNTVDGGAQSPGSSHDMEMENNPTSTTTEDRLAPISKTINFRTDGLPVSLPTRTSSRIVAKRGKKVTQHNVTKQPRKKSNKRKK